MLPTSAFVLAVLPVLDATVLAPKQPLTVRHTRRQMPDCQHPGGVRGIDPSCWQTLDMTQYTKDWWTKNSPDCAGLGFSTCFLGKHNLGTHDCTGMRPGACPTPDPPSDGTAQDWYILYNIYSINQVFNSLYTAIGNANTLASESVGAIVTLLDPPKTTNVLLNDLLTALNAGLGLIPGPESQIVQLILHTAQQLPGIAKYLFPVGTAQTQIDQWASLANEVGTLVKDYQGNISQIIPAVNNDIDNFIAFASTGSFSTFPPPDAAVESDALLKGQSKMQFFKLVADLHAQGLHTYIIGQALGQNNIQIARAIDTDINELQLNSSDNLAYDTGCGKGYDANGICSAFWFDRKAKVTYSLNNYKSMATNYHNQLSAMFGNWTSGDLLFGGAARCAASGGLKGTLAQTVIGNKGVVTPDCLSSGKICTWDVNSLEVDHEFTDCPSQPNYVTAGCTGRCGNSDGSSNANVPNGYIGGYLQNAFITCVCNS